MVISVIIPVYQEKDNKIFNDALLLLSYFEKIEVLCIGKGLDLATKKIIDKYPNAQYFPTSFNSRADRLNDGLRISTGDLVIFHHPRSCLTREGINYLISNQDNFTWGAFTHKFDKDSLFYRLTSWYSNNIRGKKKNIYYLDHCLFINLRKIAKEKCYFPQLHIFEDTKFSENMRKLAQPTLLPYLSTTSSIRFDKKGKLKQALLNQALKIAYNLNISDKTMNKIYERNIDLNSTYDERLS